MTYESQRGFLRKKKRVIYADGNWRGKKKLKEKRIHERCSMMWVSPSRSSENIDGFSVLNV